MGFILAESRWHLSAGETSHSWTVFTDGDNSCVGDLSHMSRPRVGNSGGAGNQRKGQPSATENMWPFCSGHGESMVALLGGKLNWEKRNNAHAFSFLGT